MQNKTSSASRLALFPPSLLPSSCDNIPYLFFKGGKENQTEVVSLWQWVWSCAHQNVFIPVSWERLYWGLWSNDQRNSGRANVHRDQRSSSRRPSWQLWMSEVVVPLSLFPNCLCFCGRDLRLDWVTVCCIEEGAANKYVKKMRKGQRRHFESLWVTKINVPFKKISFKKLSEASMHFPTAYCQSFSFFWCWYINFHLFVKYFLNVKIMISAIWFTSFSHPLNQTCKMPTIFCHPKRYKSFDRKKTAVFWSKVTFFLHIFMGQNFHSCFRSRSEGPTPSPPVTGSLTVKYPFLRHLWVQGKSGAEMCPAAALEISLSFNVTFTNSLTVMTHLPNQIFYCMPQNENSSEKWVGQNFWSCFDFRLLIQLMSSSLESSLSSFKSCSFRNTWDIMQIFCWSSIWL